MNYSGQWHFLWSDIFYFSPDRVLKIFSTFWCCSLNKKVCNCLRPGLTISLVLLTPTQENLYFSILPLHPSDSKSHFFCATWDEVVFYFPLHISNSDWVPSANCSQKHQLILHPTWSTLNNFFQLTQYYMTKEILSFLLGVLETCKH